MHRRRRLFAIVVLVGLVFSLVASAIPAFAHEDEGPTPANGETPQEQVSFPPMVPGVASGVRVFVRTSAVNPTEYLYVRQAIVDAGFPDVLEVSPGSFIVDLGKVEGEAEKEALARLGSVDKVSEIASAPQYSSVDTTGPVRTPDWVQLLLFATVLFAVFLTLVLRNSKRSRRG